MKKWWNWNKKVEPEVSKQESAPTRLEQAFVNFQLQTEELATEIKQLRSQRIADELDYAEDNAIHNGSGNIVMPTDNVVHEPADEPTKLASDQGGGDIGGEKRPGNRTSSYGAPATTYHSFG